LDDTIVDDGELKYEVLTIDTLYWIKSHSQSLNAEHKLDDLGIGQKNSTWHGSGHGHEEVVPAILTTMIGGAVFIAICAVYIFYLVYCRKKLLAKPWIKQYQDRSQVYMDSNGEE
jgi:hypothetical protein